MKRFRPLLLACLSPLLLASASGRYGLNTALTVPFDLHFEIPNPVASSINPIGKIPRTAIGATFSCVARGGTATDLILALRECTGAGATICGSVLTTNIEIDAVDTEVVGTISDATWTAGGYLELDVVSVTSSPTSVFCHAGAP